MSVKGCVFGQVRGSVGPLALLVTLFIHLHKYLISEFMGIIITLIVFATLIAFLASMVMGSYNSLVKFRNRYQNAFVQIDTQLRHRYDLIPYLLDIMNGYISHERETLEAVMQARNVAVSAHSVVAQSLENPRAMQDLGAAEAALTEWLDRLLTLAESYPDLKGDHNTGQLMEELVSTDKKISFARQGFNDAVMLYNTKRQVFPSSIIANLFNFSEVQLMEDKDPAIQMAQPVTF